MTEPTLDRDLMDLFGEGVRGRVGQTQSGEDESPLQAAELAVIQRAVPKRRREFVMGRRLAHEILAQWDVHGFALLPDADRCPIWPKGLLGSISHCARFCAVVVASSEAVRSVGLDVEPAESLDEKLIDRICNPEELSGLAPEARGERAKLLFSIKEAVYKCQFPLSRTFLGFHDVRVQLQGDRFVAVIEEEKAAQLAAREIRGGFSLRAGHVFSAARLDY